MEQIHKDISGKFSTHKYKLYNSYVFNWESDYFSITQDEKYMYEVEVKLSRSDFFADFKKNNKHRLLLAAFKKEKITKIFNTFKCLDENKKIIEACPLEYISASEYTPNKFYYCCPEGMIKVEEVPSYAGLLYIRKDYNEVYQVKPAPFIHKTNNVDKKLRTLIDKFYFQFEKMRSEHTLAKNRNKDYERMKLHYSELVMIKHLSENNNFLEEINYYKEDERKLKKQIIDLRYEKSDLQNKIEELEKEIDNLKNK